MGRMKTMKNKYQKAVDMAKDSIGSGRAEKLRRVQQKIDDLKSRGLLKKQEYVSLITMPDLER